MRIILNDDPQTNVIAREDQLGRLEGEFFVGVDQHVRYRHPFDTRVWLAGSDAETFRNAAIAWNSYCNHLRGRTENEQLGQVQWLRRQLLHLGMLDDRPDNLWLVLLEQAETGLL